MILYSVGNCGILQLIMNSIEASPGFSSSVWPKHIVHLIVIVTSFVISFLSEKLYFLPVTFKKGQLRRLLTYVIGHAKYIVEIKFFFSHLSFTCSHSISYENRKRENNTFQFKVLTNNPRLQVETRSQNIVDFQLSICMNTSARCQFYSTHIK